MMDSQCNQASVHEEAFVSGAARLRQSQLLVVRPFTIANERILISQMVSLIRGNTCK